MTHEEKIALLVGEYLEISQYVLYSAFKATSLFQQMKRDDAYLHGQEQVDIALADAESRLKWSEGRSDEELIGYLKGKGLSRSEERDVEDLIRRRSHLMSLFFIEHSDDLASQDALLYDKIIDELDERCESASLLNRQLSKTIDGFLDKFSKF